MGEVYLVGNLGILAVDMLGGHDGLYLITFCAFVRLFLNNVVVPPGAQKRDHAKAPRQTCRAKHQVNPTPSSLLTRRKCHEAAKVGVA